jgi:predicted deacylase
VLDLHCCFDASRHLFTLPSQAAIFSSLAARLNCAAVLTAEVSGGNSFDEACSVPWQTLSRLYPHAGFDPDTCASCTVELGGMADTEPSVAAASCEAILSFLWEKNCIAKCGGVDGCDFLPPPSPTCDATPLAAVHEVMPPHSGVVSFMVEIGARVSRGQPLFQICDPVSDKLTTVLSPADGCMYNRERLRFAQPGLWICKVTYAS